MIWYFYSSTIMAALLCQNSIIRDPLSIIFFSRDIPKAHDFFLRGSETRGRLSPRSFFTRTLMMFFNDPYWSNRRLLYTFFLCIYIHIIERGSRSTRGPRVYILYTTIIHVTLVNVVLVKNEWSAAQTRVDSKTSVTVYTILEHLQVSHAHVWHLF